MPEDYHTPDILPQFMSLRECLDDFCRECADELGDNNKLTLKAELLYMRVIGLTDDIERVTMRLYEES